MNKHVDRMKRGAVALSEFIALAGVTGAIFGVFGGFYALLYRMMDTVGGAIAIGVFVVLAITIYALGVADAKDEGKNKPATKKE